MAAQDLFNAIFNASLAIMVTTLVAGLGVSRSVGQILAPMPIGLVVIGTVLHSQGSYLVPGLIFTVVGTVIPFAIGLEIGRLHEHAPAAVPDASPNVAGAV